MPNPVWPPTLPQTLPVQSPESADENKIVSEMDAGPRKMRRRYTAVSRFYRPDSGRWVFSRAQRDALLAFYDTTLVSGTLRFDWLEPVPGIGSVECRIMERPVMTPITAGATRYECEMELEVLP